MSRPPLPQSVGLRPYASALRKSSTPEENHLWYDFLQSYPIRFNRQKVIGGYIADFYSRYAKLVVELDGAQHFETEALEHDRLRTSYFEGLGLQVLRFSNAEVSRRFSEVCATIDAVVSGHIDVKAVNGSYRKARR